MVRVRPGVHGQAITHRVGGQLDELSGTFTRLLRIRVDSMSLMNALDDSGQTRTVDLSLTSVDFRVWA